MLLTAEPDDIAREVVMALLGHRWTWPYRTVIEVYTIGGTRTVFLSGRPAREIIGVTYADTDEAIPCSYVCMAGSTLIIGGRGCAEHGNGGCPTYRGRDLKVEYTFGSEPPATVCRAIEVLADEVQAAQSGSECRLPERVTTVSRQGGSWTVLDPQDFLTEGRTGLYEVDLALSQYTGPNRVMARARVFTPDMMPGRRLEVDGAPVTEMPTTP